MFSLKHEKEYLEPVMVSVPEEKYCAMLDKIDRLESALIEIYNWSLAYPLSVFPEPDFVKVRSLLEAGGITVDSVSASNIRFVVSRVAEIASKALEASVDPQEAAA